MVNEAKYTIHGSYGYRSSKSFHSDSTGTALGAAPLEFSETKERYFEAQDENFAMKKGPRRCFGYIGDYILYNWVSMVYREYNYHLGCYTGIIINHYMAGVQNSRSKGSYKVGPIGIEKLILHLRYEAGPIGNHAVPKLGASIALAWR